MAQQLALAPLAEDPGSVPITHLVGSQLPVSPGSLIPHQVSTGICTHVEHTETHRPI